MQCPATKAACHESCSGRCQIAVRAAAHSKFVSERRKGKEEDTDIVPTLSVHDYYANTETVT